MIKYYKVLHIYAQNLIHSCFILFPVSYPIDLCLWLSNEHILGGQCGSPYYSITLTLGWLMDQWCSTHICCSSQCQGTTGNAKFTLSSSFRHCLIQLLIHCPWVSTIYWETMCEILILYYSHTLLVDDQWSYTSSVLWGESLFYILSLS